MNNITEYENIDVYLSQNRVNNYIKEIDSFLTTLPEKYNYELNNYIWKCDSKVRFINCIDYLYEKLSNYKNDLTELLNTIKNIEKIQKNLKEIKILEAENAQLKQNLNEFDKIKILDNEQKIKDLEEMNESLNNSILNQWR